LKYSGKITGLKKSKSTLRRIQKVENGEYLEVFDDLQIKRNIDHQIISAYILTTPGRILINELIAAAIYARPMDFK
jgi:hypothetical protein